MDYDTCTDEDQTNQSMNSRTEYENDDFKQDEHPHILPESSLNVPRSNGDEAFLDDLVKEIAIEVYGLIQMAMQTGPLVGSSPGYFKRCGAEVAEIALKFILSLPLQFLISLQSTNDIKNVEQTGISEKHDDSLQQKHTIDNHTFAQIPISTSIPNLCFSEKQISNISKWRTNADKAAKKGSPPSKSMKLKQTQFEKKKSSNNRKGKEKNL